MSNCIIVEHDVPITIISDDCNAEPVVITAVESTTVLIESEPEVVEINAGARGLPGTDVELQKSATHVQWRLNKDGAAWQDLIAIADLVGPPSMAEAPADGTPYARKDGAWAAAATAAQGAKADAAIPAAQKGAVNGVATLDAGGKIPESQIPAVAITDVFTVASQSAMLALTAERGDIAVRSDLNKSFALAAEPASTLANWIELRTPTDAVLSVAGKTGAVTLTNTDVGAAPVNTALTDAAASSTLPATASTALTALLQTVRNCLKWLVSNTVQISGAQTVAGVKTYTGKALFAGASTTSSIPSHSATPTFDCAASNVFEPATMTGNITSITLSNATAGQTVQIRLQQDATGGRTCAVPSGAKIDGSINTGANRVTWLIMTYSYRGSRWEGNFLQVPS